MITDISLFSSEKTKIIDIAVQWQKDNYPTRTRDYYKCTRDLTYIINAFIHDLNSNNTSNTIYIANKFWSRGKRQIVKHEVEVAVYNFIVDYIERNYTLSNEFILNLTSLKNILVNIIETGEIVQPNSWEHSAHLRINTYNWITAAPSVEQIQSIIKDLHDYSPSKQRVVRYNIDVYRNDNIANRNKIYRAHAADTSDASRHNPQVLAPWLLFFSKRKVSKPFHDTDFYLDLGIATSTIIYSAADKGIDSGISRCVNYPNLIKEVIGYAPEITIGLGYRSPDPKYLCPHYNRPVLIPSRDHDTKPSLEEYVKYV